MVRFRFLGAILIAALAFATPSHAARPDGRGLIAAGEKLKTQLNAATAGSTPPMLSNADAALIRAAFDADTVRTLPLDDVAVVGGACVSIGEAVIAYGEFMTRTTDGKAAADALGLKLQDELTLGVIAANLCVQRGFQAIDALVAGMAAEQRGGTQGPLKQMRDGGRQTITGTLETATTTGVKPANLSRMLAAALENAAVVAASFPAAERAAFRTEILGFAARVPAASRKQVEALGAAFAAGACNSLCQAAGG